jgi:hypothetical protein
MIKVLILAAQNNVSDERMELPSWLHFSGLGSWRPHMGRTDRLLREQLICARAIEKLFEE